MTRKIFFTVFCFIFLLLLSFNSLHAEQRLIFGVFPALSSHSLLKNFSFIGNLIEKELGRNVKIVSAASVDQFNQRAIEGNYDLMWLCPACYIKVHQKTDIQVLAMGFPGFQGITIVRKDSGINKLEDLRGKKIKAVRKKAVAGFLFLRNQLAAKGIFAPQEVTFDFAGTTESLPFLVYSKKFDAAVFNEGYFVKSTYYKKIRGDLKIISRSGEIPQSPFAIKTSISSAERNKIQHILVETSKADPYYPVFLKAMGYKGIQAATDADFDSFREFYAQSLQFNKIISKQK